MPELLSNPLEKTRIRSFVRRQGRITQAQQHALETLWPNYGIETLPGIDLGTAFPRPAPLILEIGFGNGESLAQMALAAPEKNFLGIEVHRPGVGHLLIRIEQLGLGNVRICNADALEVMEQHIAEASLSGLQLFFPDPWHKKRHNKRRLVNDKFVALTAQKLMTGGVIHMATDWEDYARQMLDVLQADSTLENMADNGGYSKRPDYRPLTKFERRGQLRGHGVWDILFKRL
ncbi:tRNA (guanosine(46)-N7)-methyltransferase TrmB [Candidatus Methylospira mobilis]|uniref:tRNA (guanine-N(7)-)-methyltransferase n=1 Tax=Candidatus Methylospira mobilis TaxID=1808979 RepID=A0A5Q0BJC9_9GAMM|nr:tRNA (guanosine(46)-N7)-methyltransferase TrmB [Candidatus Methylospira mobilis]QFY41916.1 tRNA (guanosine(46)-N7)-methyltransferase TrmB [Candidatus Methylospira mobilis]WNV02901.1 tRNA (guanosine(46)-N7)-methyltransferase TrmB [Candidatus Methylospira mobilis]